VEICIHERIAEESRMIELDEFDRRILAALQKDGRITNVALAEVVALSPSQCARRLQRLEEAGAVRGYGAFLNPAALGLGITALVTVTLEKHARANIKEFREIVLRRAEIVECLAITGDGDFQLRIVARDLASFSQFLMDVVIPMPGVATTRSHIVLEQVKSTTALPIAVP
jgi:Lrp/AsnC family transcriptional regulator, leucine-responsive regulatory protein